MPTLLCVTACVHHAAFNGPYRCGFVCQVVALCLRDGAVESAIGQVVQAIQEQASALERCCPHSMCMCCLSPDTCTCVAVVCALVCRAHEVALHPREVLGLCIHLYSLAGPDTSIPVQYEEQLQVGHVDV